MNSFEGFNSLNDSEWEKRLIAAAFLADEELEWASFEGAAVSRMQELLVTLLDLPEAWAETLCHEILGGINGKSQI